MTPFSRSLLYQEGGNLPRYSRCLEADAVDLGQASDCFCSQCMALSNPESARCFCCWTFGDSMTQAEACERVVENTRSPKSSISILYDSATL